MEGAFVYSEMQTVQCTRLKQHEYIIVIYNCSPTEEADTHDKLTPT
jgi:hypothetical protein